MENAAKKKKKKKRMKIAALQVCKQAIVQPVYHIVVVCLVKFGIIFSNTLIVTLLCISLELSH